MRSQPAVLVIDDDRNFCRILDVKLRRSGFDVHITHDSATAYAALMEQEYDIVLLDLRLPDADGLAILPRLKAVAAATPVLVITAYEEEQLRVRARQAGAVDVLYKPFDLDLLVQSVRRYLECSARPCAVSRGQYVHVTRERGEPAEWNARVVAVGADVFELAIEPGPEVRAPIEAGSFLRVDLTGADGLYAFRTRVRRADSEGRIVLAKPDLIRRVQRRKHARAALQGDVEIRTRDGGTIRAKGRDVSVGGIGVLLDRPIAVGEVIDASWQLTSAASKVLPAQATAAVVRCDPVWDAEGYAVCRAGLQFTELPATLRRRISAYISRHG